tara:strand:- start:503 stop:1966 length:1464 start_codon:yes stop_codon:yes gene_type:complete
MFKARTHLSNSIFLTIRFFSVTLFNLLFTKYAIASLGYEKYGHFVLVASFLVSLQFLNTVIISVSSRYLSVVQNKGKRDIKKEFSNVFDLHLIIALASLIIGLVISNNFLNIENDIDDVNINALSFLYFGSLVSVFLNILSTPFQALLIANTSFLAKSLVESLHAVFKFLSIIIILPSIDNFSSLCYLFPAFTAISPLLFVLAAVLFHKNQILIKLKFNLNSIIDRVKFSFWTSFGAFNFMLKTQFLVLIAYYFYGPKYGAISAITNQVFFAVWSLVGIFNQAIQPSLTKSSYKGINFDVLSMMNLNFRSIFILSIFILQSYLFYSHYVFDIWLGVDFPKIILQITSLVIVSVIFESSILSSHTIVNAKGVIRNYQLILSSPLLFILILCIIFFDGFISLYYALAINSVLVFSLALIYLKKNLQIPLNKFIKLKYDELVFNIILLSIIVASFTFDIPIILKIMITIFSSILLIKLLIRNSVNLNKIS